MKNLISGFSILNSDGNIQLGMWSCILIMFFAIVFGVFTGMYYIKSSQDIDIQNSVNSMLKAQNVISKCKTVTQKAITTRNEKQYHLLEKYGITITVDEGD